MIIIHTSLLSLSVFTSITWHHEYWNIPCWISVTLTRGSLTWEWWFITDDSWSWWWCWFLMVGINKRWGCKLWESWAWAILIGRGDDHEQDKDIEDGEEDDDDKDHQTNDRRAWHLFASWYGGAPFPCGEDNHHYKLDSQSSSSSTKEDDDDNHHHPQQKRMMMIIIIIPNEEGW